MPGGCSRKRSGRKLRGSRVDRPRCGGSGRRRGRRPCPGRQVVAAQLASARSSRRTTTGTGGQQPQRLLDHRVEVGVVARRRGPPPAGARSFSGWRSSRSKAQASEVEVGPSVSSVISSSRRSLLAQRRAVLVAGLDQHRDDVLAAVLAARRGAGATSVQHRLFDRRHRARGSRGCGRPSAGPKRQQRRRLPRVVQRTRSARCSSVAQASEAARRPSAPKTARITTSWVIACIRGQSSNGSPTGQRPTSRARHLGHHLGVGAHRARRGRRAASACAAVMCSGSSSSITERGPEHRPQQRVGERRRRPSAPAVKTRLTSSGSQSRTQCPSGRMRRVKVSP